MLSPFNSSFRFAQRVAALFFLTGAHSLRGSENIIDLTKPVSETLTPDVIYWKFDDGIIGDSMPDPVSDLSGNNLNGALLAGDKKPQPNYVKGKFGTAIHVEGNTPNETDENGKMRTFPNPRITWRAAGSDRPDDQTLDLAGKSFSGGVWVKFDEILSGERQIVYVFHRGVPPVSHWSFALMKTPTGEWTLNFYVPKLAKRIESPNFYLDDNDWHHIGFSFEVGEVESTLTFWMDGERLGDPMKTDGSIPPTERINERVFTLGEGNVGNFGNGLVGAFDDAFVTTGVYSFMLPK
jgi:hypothetical protein